MSKVEGQLVDNLKELIQMHHIEQVLIYDSRSSEPGNQGSDWFFSHGFIQVNQVEYDLGNLFKYCIDEQTLSLYF